MSRVDDICMILIALGVIIAAFVNFRQDSRLDHLNARVSCLEHPHAESSIAATRINGRFVITQPAHRTGCP